MLAVLRRTECWAPVGHRNAVMSELADLEDFLSELVEVVRHYERPDDVDELEAYRDMLEESVRLCKIVQSRIGELSAVLASGFESPMAEQDDARRNRQRADNGRTDGDVQSTHLGDVSTRWPIDLDPRQVSGFGDASSLEHDQPVGTAARDDENDGRMLPAPRRRDDRVRWADVERLTDGSGGITDRWPDAIVQWQSTPRIFRTNRPSSRRRAARWMQPNSAVRWVWQALLLSVTWRQLSASSHVRNSRLRNRRQAI